MTNSITNFHASAQSVADLDEALARGQQNKPQLRTPSSKHYLKLDPQGNGWMYGSDDVEVQDGSLWAVNPFSFQTGWICWADKKMNNMRSEKLGEVLQPIQKRVECPDVDHSEKGGEWKEQVAVDLVCISGED